MKTEIHPEYQECQVTCGCGNTFTTRSTVNSMSVDICGACHPFYTGQQRFVDAAGRVEKFQKRQKVSQEIKQAQKGGKKAKQEEQQAKRQAHLDKAAELEKARQKLSESDSKASDS